MKRRTNESWLLMTLLATVVLATAGCKLDDSEDLGFPGGLPIERVSRTGSGTQGNDGSDYASISADGRYVAFSSYATNLVAGDTNNRPDIFVYDRQGDTIERASLSYNGSEANNNCIGVSLSADGRYVAFNSLATNLLAGDTNARRDVFVHDRQNGTIERVSVDSVGTQANDNCDGASISADGRYVAFYSDATNLVAGDANGQRDIFVYDRQTDTIELASVSSGGIQGNAMSRSPSISADSRYVAFESDATNLVAGDANGMMDVFVYDRQTDTIELVSVSSGGIQGNNDSKEASISADGRFIVFESDATNLVTGDSNLVRDVFVYDRQTDTTKLVSVSSGGTQGDIDSNNAAISADGRYAAFESDATNLVTGDTNNAKDVFAAPLQ